VPPLPRPLTLTLSPPSAEAWRRACGIAPECAAPPSWSVRLGGAREARLTLPAGRYVARWEGNCARQEDALTLSAAAPAPRLAPPPLSCRSPLTAVDALTLDPLPLPVDAVGEGERVALAVEGYEPLTVEGPAGGAPVEARLRRCAARLAWSVTPADAAVEAPRAVRWGVPAAVRVSREGYLPVERVVEAPRPARCAGAAVLVEVALSRPVRVSARGEGGAPVSLAQLWVGGLAAAPGAPLARPPGDYALAAEAAGHAPLSGALRVPPCGLYAPSPPREGRQQGPRRADLCAEVALALSLEPLPPPPSPARALRRAGLAAGGVGAALLGLSAVEQARYASSGPSPLLGARREAIDGARLWAAGLLAAGALTYGAGLLLPLLGAPEGER